MSNITKRQTDELDLIYKAHVGEIEEDALPIETRERAARMRYITTLIFHKKAGKAWQFRSNHSLIPLVKAQFPKVKDYTIRQDIRMVQRLYPIVEESEREFRKMLLRHSIEETINEARNKGNLKVVASSERNLMLLDGFDKDVPEGGTSVVINVNGYNPALIGAKPIKNLDELIEKQLAEDVEREKEELGDYVQYELVENAEKS